MSLQMKDNHSTVWDALNEFKSICICICYEPLRVRLTGTARKSTVIDNKLLPTDVADRWQLLGIIKPVKKKEELPLCTW